eukprot:7249993-Prymnesium_polylepis.1
MKKASNSTARDAGTPCGSSGTTRTTSLKLKFSSCSRARTCLQLLDLRSCSAPRLTRSSVRPT